MSQEAEEILQFLVRLKDCNINRSTQDEINKITEGLGDLCKTNPNSLAGFIEILRTNPDTKLRLYAAVNINVCLRYQWAENPEKGQWLDQFFSTIIEETEGSVRSNFINQVSKIISAETIGQVLVFAESSLESQNPVSIESSIILLESSVKYITKDPTTSELLLNLTQAGLSLGIEDTTIQSFSLFFAYHSSCKGEEESDEANPAAVEMYNTFLSSIPEHFASEDYVLQASRLIDQYILSPFTDLDQTFVIIMELYEQTEAGSEQSNNLEIAIDAICNNFPHTVANSGKALEIFNRYLITAAESFEPESHLSELVNFDRFSSLAVAIAVVDEIMEAFWNLRDTIMDCSETYAGAAAFYLTLANTMKTACDFFESKTEDGLDGLVDVILPGLESESLAVRDCVCECISEFCGTYPMYIPDYAEMFVEPLLSTGENAGLTEELLGVLYTLFYNCEDTDPFFENAFALLSASFESGEFDQTMLSSLKCISQLSQHSSQLITSHVEEIFEFMKTIMEGDDSASLLRADAVNCIISLLLRCQDFFRGSAGEIAEFFVTCMGETDDVKLVNDAINGFGFLVRTFPSEVEEVIEPAMETLMQLIEQEKNDEVREVAQQLKMNAELSKEDDERYQEFFDDDNMGYPGAALLLFSAILAQYPQLIEAHAEYVIEKASVFVQSCVNPSNGYALRALTALSEGLKRSGSSLPELTVKFFEVANSVLSETNSCENAGYAMEAIATLASSIPDENKEILIQILDSAIRGKIPACEGSIPKGLEDPIAFLFREVVSVFKDEMPESLTSLVIEKLVPMSDDDATFAFYAFELIGFFVEAVGLPDEDIVKHILNNAIQKAPLHVGYEAFFLINKIAEKHPDITAEFAELILQMANTVMQSKKLKSPEYLRQMDNLVSALGTIAIKVIPDSFPEELLIPCLNLMPARADPEEDINLFQFFFYINERIDQSSKPELLSPVLIRLFAEDDHMKSEWILDEVTVNALKQMLIKLLRHVGDAGTFMQTVLGNNESALGNIQAVLST